MTPVMSVASITKKYGPFIAVDALSFEVYPGEILGFLGPNGAGKTTTVNMISGLLIPDSGSINILGNTVKRKKDPLYHHIGLSPQELVIWRTLTCIEQLVFLGTMYGASVREARKRGERLLDEFGLTEKRHKLASRLSGGMQRRLNIALALVHDPRILILDEPQAGLDPQSRLLVREYILRLKTATEMAVIITTHDMEEAEKLSDQVCIIDHGKRLVLDTIDNIKKTAGTSGSCRLRVEGMTSEELKLFLTEMLPKNAISLSETNLEDVFIQLTGRELRE